MAAPMACRGMLRCASGLKHAEPHCLGYMQVRYKQKKTQRYKSPHESQKHTNQTWVSRKKVLDGKPKDTRGTDNPLWKSKVPTDDVWIRLYYPKQSMPLEEAIARHREYAVPEILDSEDSIVYADMTLNMTTAKKTKFVGQLKSFAHIPHQFEDQQQRRCIVFCETLEEQQKALELGAVAAGYKDLIESIQNRDLTLDDFDFVLCTPDLLSQLIPIRAILKERFPVPQNRNLSPNIEEMMILFRRAISYTSQRVGDGVARTQIPFGQLNMPVAKLLENFREITQSLSSNRPAKLGPMITKTQIVCPPSEERFTLQLHGYIPGYEQAVPTQTVTVEEEVEDQQGEEEDSDDEAAVSAKR